MEVSQLEKRMEELADMVGTEINIVSAKTSFSGKGYSGSAGKIAKKKPGKTFATAGRAISAPVPSGKDVKRKAIAAPSVKSKAVRPEQVIPFDKDEFKDF